MAEYAICGQFLYNGLNICPKIRNFAKNHRIKI